MTKQIPRPTVEDLIQAENWVAAQRLIQEELRTDPENHWLLTQLGVTFYEQRQYREALEHFARSAKIVPDCPLTLWNLAGALAALGKPRVALEIYTWLALSRRTAEDDSCWESEDWADSLRTDCVFRAASCFERLNDPVTAEELYRRYILLLSMGSNGSYTAEDALRRLREIRGTSAGRNTGKTARRTTIREIFALPEVHRLMPGSHRLPKIDVATVLAD